MNIAYPGTKFIIEAKASRNRNGHNILYSFIERSNKYFLNKKQIFSAQIEACKKLSVELSHADEITTVKNEIRELETSIQRPT